MAVDQTIPRPPSETQTADHPLWDRAAAHLLAALDQIDATDSCYRDGPVVYGTASWLAGCIRRALREVAAL